MLRQLQAEFEIDDVKHRVQEFVSSCLLCKHVKGGNLIQRPWNVSHTATKRNEILHMDFLFMGDSYRDNRYLLALKDDLTHYCELVACESATGLVAASAVLDWYKRFGLPEMWVSVNGSHFQNALMEDLQQRLGAVHRFVPVYTPWLNGTIERLNRDILQVTRVLLLEFQLDLRNWEFLLPVIQSNLNHTQVRSLQHHTPAEMFTGLPYRPVTNSVLRPRSNGAQPEVVTGDLSACADQLDQLRASLREMHAHVIDAKEKRRLYQRAMKKGNICAFTIGDFVLWSRADPRIQGRKLMVRWVGPFRIVEVLPTSFLIEHLLTKERYDVHATRLKHYSGSQLEVTEELTHHVALQGINLGVRAVRDARYNRQSREWELLISWVGLEDVENSWESFDGMYESMPDLVTGFVQASADSKLKKYLQGLLDDIGV